MIGRVEYGRENQIELKRIKFVQTLRKTGPSRFGQCPDRHQQKLALVTGFSRGSPSPESGQTCTGRFR